MKKSSLILSLTAIALLFTATHCKNPPIFAAIEQEVKLKKASVTGIIRGIVEIHNTIYVTNGKLFSKPAGAAGTWNAITTFAPCDSIATDGSSLYAALDGNSYVRVSNTWKPITPQGLVFITGTNTVFATDGKKIYVVNGTSANVIENAKGILKGAAGNYCMTNTGIYDANGSQIGGPTSELKALCKGPGDGVLVLAGNTLYAYDGGWTTYTHTVVEPQSVTYLESKQLILISGKEGFAELKLRTATANVSDAQAVQVGSSESSIAPEYYYQYKNSVGKWNINPIAAFSHKAGYTLYAGALDGHNTKHTGLWGFYHSSQLEWNRE